MTASITSSTCPRCGQPVAASAPEGLCARCLFGSIMADDDDHAPAIAAVVPPRFGDYELLGIIARGGAGVVHRARHVGLDRVVALKILAEAHDDAPDFIERFRTEAAAAASLEHPHIVPVYDFGAHEGRQFLAMKLIEGGATTAPTTVKEAARRLIIVARAVHYAHQRGVLHRDLKPANILLDAAGEPHLTDFGLAKLIARDSTLTRTQALLGTPAYMAPEQAAGRAREITTATDVYGLGALLYHWLAGAPPFAGGTTLETIHQVIDADPAPPSRRNSAVDRDLDTICLKCLRKEPAARYASADALADDLDRWQRGEPVLARRITALERVAKWTRRNRPLAAVLAVSLIALLAGTALLAMKTAQLSAARSDLSVLATAQRRDLASLHVATGNRLMIEGDGFAALKSFAEAAALDADKPARLAMHQFRFAAALSQLPPIERSWPHEGALYTAAFSADGTRVVTGGADRAAHVWDVASGAAVTPPLPHGAPVWWAGFSLDGKKIITRTSAGDIQLWDADSGAPAAGPFHGRGSMSSARDALASAVTLSPDGAQFVVLGERAVELRRVSDGTLSREPLPCPQQPGHAVFTPDGARLAVVCEEGAVVNFDTASGAVIASQSLKQWQPEKNPFGWRNAAWSPDASRLALTDRAFAARILSADLQRLSTPLAHTDMVLGATWLRDARRVLTWSHDNTARIWDAATLQAAVPPMRHRGPVHHAALSPDETTLATGCHDGTSQIWDATTGEARGPLLRHGGPVRIVEWSHDGRRLLTASADGRARVWQMERLARPLFRWTHGQPAESARLSPDARLAATLVIGPDVEIWSLETGSRIATLKHPSRVQAIAWRDDVRVLTVCADFILREWDARDGTLLRETKAADLPAAKLAGITLSPDARWLGSHFNDGAALLHDTMTGELRLTLARHRAQFFSWSPCGRFIALQHPAAHASEIILYDAATARPAGAPVALPDGCTAFALSHGATHLAYATEDNKAWVLDLATRRRTGPFAHDSTVRALTFAAGATILASGAQDGTLHLWDTATTEPLAPPLRHPSWIVSITATPDHRTFIVSENGGHASVWTIPALALSPLEMQKIAGDSVPK